MLSLWQVLPSWPVLNSATYRRCDTNSIHVSWKYISRTSQNTDINQDHGAGYIALSIFDRHHPWTPILNSASCYHNRKFVIPFGFPVWYPVPALFSRLWWKISPMQPIQFRTAAHWMKGSSELSPPCMRTNITEIADPSIPSASTTSWLSRWADARSQLSYSALLHFNAIATIPRPLLICLSSETRYLSFHWWAYLYYMRR